MTSSRVGAIPSSPVKKGRESSTPPTKAGVAVEEIFRKPSPPFEMGSWVMWDWMDWLVRDCIGRSRGHSNPPPVSERGMERPVDQSLLQLSGDPKDKQGQPRPVVLFLEKEADRRFHRACLSFSSSLQAFSLVEVRETIFWSSHHLTHLSVPTGHPGEKCRL